LGYLSTWCITTTSFRITAVRPIPRNGRDRFTSRTQPLVKYAEYCVCLRSHQRSHVKRLPHTGTAAANAAAALPLAALAWMRIQPSQRTNLPTGLSHPLGVTSSGSSANAHEAVIAPTPVIACSFLAR